MQFKWSKYPYVIEEDLGKGCFRIKNPTTGHILRKAMNNCRLKKYYQAITQKDGGMVEQSTPYMSSTATTYPKKFQGVLESYSIVCYRGMGNHPP